MLSSDRNFQVAVCEGRSSHPGQWGVEGVEGVESGYQRRESAGPPPPRGQPPPWREGGRENKANRSAEMIKRMESCLREAGPPAAGTPE